jgi:phage gp46-like protein
MVALKIIENTTAAPSLLPDTVWDGFVGDYAPSDPTEPSNLGGLRARQPIETAILLCLMTDARAQPGDVIPDGSGDPRGWLGDRVDAGIAPIGSRLWLLRRSTLSREVADKAVLYAIEALQPLIDQKAVAAVDVAAEPNLSAGRLDMKVTVYKTDGALASSVNFSLLWDKSRGIQYPLDR